MTFDYYDNHYPKSRFWALGLSSTNIYDYSPGVYDRRNWDLIRIDYSDGTRVVFTNEDHPYLNRLGKPSVVVGASGTNLLTYDHAERVVASTCTGGLLAGITVTNHFDSFGRRDLLSAHSSSAPLLQHSFSYDAYGRLYTVSNGIYSALYGYLPNSDLLQTTTCKSNTTPLLTATRTWETGPRLRSIVNSVNGATVTSHTYRYDSLDRRIQATLEDGSLWKYDYNDRDELTAARRFWPDWAPVSGQQFAYDYDNIGNRKTASSGGDTNGWNLRTASYTANSLNEYTSIAIPGYKDICGVALAANGVTVNGGTADRKMEYFHREISIANGNGPLWNDVTVASGGASDTGGLVFPANTQTLTYDEDGNLTFDGIWTYEWDAENRLITMTMTNLANLDHTNRLRLEFVYDHQGRRIAKTVKSWTGSAFANPVTKLFLYDDWSLIAELGVNGSLLRSYLWGEDLGGVDGGAGGIGGLVAIQDNTVIPGQSSTHFAAYDCNGNVTALVNSADKSISAHYEYSACGEILRATGPMAVANVFRFSTKPTDDESGLVNYGHRCYSPALGRWLNRDPLEEDASLNLYAYVANKLLNARDALGMETAIDVESSTAEGAGMDAHGLASATRTASRVKEILNTVQDIDDIFDAVLAMDDPIGAALQVKELAWELLRAKRKGGKTGVEYHHLIPKALKEKLGKQVDQFTVALVKRLHRRLHMGNGFGRGGIWNGLWQKFMKNKGDRPTPQEIKAFMDQIARLFGLDGLPPVPYPH